VTKLSIGKFANSRLLRCANGVLEGPAPLEIRRNFAKKRYILGNPQKDLIRYPVSACEQEPEENAS
jgi:hypothetical protein